MTPHEALKAKLAELSDTEVSEVLEYVSVMESMRAYAAAPELFRGVAPNGSPHRLRSKVGLLLPGRGIPRGMIGGRSFHRP